MGIISTAYTSIKNATITEILLVIINNSIFDFLYYIILLKLRKLLTVILILQIGILYYNINHNTKQVVKKVIGMENRNISYNPIL